MAEKDEKTEEATGKKLEEARSKGKVASSQEIGGAVLLLGGLFLLVMTGGAIFENLKRRVAGLGDLRVGEFGIDDAYHLFIEYSLELAASLLPFLLGLVPLAAAVAYLQVGFKITPKKLAIDITKLNPLSGLKRIFSFAGLLKGLNALIKLLVIGWLIWSMAADAVPQLALLGDAEGLGEILTALNRISLGLGLRAGLCMLAIGVFDLWYQKYKFKKDMRMSKQEVKDEAKQSEGDPHVKARIRQMQRQRARARMMSEVPKATVVVVNPTHFSVALAYRREEHAAPVVVAKGMHLLALQIRRKAEGAGVPIVEEPPLARALYRTVELDQPIPVDLYQAVAKVLAYVMRLKTRRGA